MKHTRNESGSWKMLIFMASVPVAPTAKISPLHCCPAEQAHRAPARTRSQITRFGNTTMDLLQGHLTYKTINPEIENFRLSHIQPFLEARIVFHFSP